MTPGRGKVEGLAGSTGFVAGVGILVLLGAAALGGMRYSGGQPTERGLEGALGAVALAAVVAAPGICAVLALARRPALLLPAGIVLLPLSFLSFAGVTLPLLVPATMLLVAYGRRSAIHPVRGAWAALTTVTVLVLLVAAAVALFVREDPRSYTTPTGGGSTSDVITIEESLTSLSLVGAALTFGWLLAAAGQPKVSVRSDA